MRTWDRFKKSYLLYSFKRDPIAIISFSVLSVFVIISILAPVVAPYNTYDSSTFDIMDGETPPAWMEGGSKTFMLGTDIQGRDLLSTMIYGLRVSLLIGVGAVLFQSFVGILIGLLSGYLGGKLDAFLMRLTDIQFSIPYLIVAIFTSAIFKLAFGVGRYAELAVPLLIVIIGAAHWPIYARTVRASVLGEKNKEYVEAARVIGISRWQIMFRHVLPNIMGPIIVMATLWVATAIRIEASLSFLGLGTQPPYSSWGLMLKSGVDNIMITPWLAVFPGIAIMIAVMAFNLVGDGLRDALDPKLQG